MIVDGRKITEEIKMALRREIEKMRTPPMLVVFTIGDNPATLNYLSAKERFAKDIGVVLEIARLDSEITQEAFIDRIKTVASDPLVTGIIVQLPLPTYLDTEAICAAIPVQKDPDLLSRKAQENFIHSSSVILPPVVAAIDTIFSKYEVSLLDKKVAVIGQGKLVGVPVVTWLKQKDILSLIVDRKMLDDKSCLKEADVIISGAGVPNLITMDMVKDGVVLIDAGTSEAGGKIAGDIDPACAIKAALFTPVPGGVGPVTVAMLFKNLITLAS